MRASFLTLKWLRRQGMVVGTVERWVPRARKRRDLFGIIDIIAIIDGRIVGIQAYRSGHKRHVERLYENADLIMPWLQAGAKLQFWWWRKVKGKWLPRVTEFVVEDGQLKEVSDAD